MPRLEVEGAGTFEVEEGKRLVLAIEEDAGVDIIHQCGSYAHCATCRVEFVEGDPEDMTQDEQMVLEMRARPDGRGAARVPDLLRRGHEGAGPDDRDGYRG